MNNLKILEFYLRVIISTSYVFLLTSLPSIWFRDRENYRIIAESSRGYFDNIEFSFLLKEPIFITFNYILSFIFKYETIPYVFVFAIASSLIYFLNIMAKNFVLFILGVIAILVIPFLFHMQLVVLRQGLATVLLIYLILKCRKDNVFLLSSFILMFVHNSFLIFPFIFLSYFLLKKFYDNVFFVAFILSISIFSIYQISTNVLSNLGVYQLSYQNVDDVSVSGGNFILIFVVLCCFCFFVFKKNNRLHEITIILFAIYLSLYFVSPLIGRYAVTFMPLLIICLINESKVVNYLLLLTVILIYSYVSFAGAIYHNSLLVLPFWSVG